MNARPSVGSPHTTRKGVYLVGFCYSFLNHFTKKRIRSRNGRPFPIWKKLDHPPLVQLSLLE